MTPHHTVTLISNAGVVLELNGHTVWIDALHIDRTPGFSSVSPALWDRMRISLPTPDLLFFTHCHPDHYSRRLVREARALWPKVLLALPQREFEDQLLLSGRETRFSDGGFTFQFLRLPHEGPKELDVPHYGLILSDGSFCVLITGDCAPACPVLTEFLNGLSIDLAILNFPWLTLRKGRQFLEEVLRPQHLLLCHLPFPEDDDNGYLDAARRAAGEMKLPDVRLLTRPLQREEF